MVIMYIPADQVSSSAGRNSQTLKHRQQGAALIVGLIMLLLLTLIGVAGMRDTLLQEKMVGNMIDREVALQAAESALRTAEDKIAKAGTVSLSVDGIGVQNVLPRTPTNVTESAFWHARPWNNTDSAVYGFTLPQVAAQPRYVIEFVGQTDGSGYASGGSATLVLSEELSSDVQTGSIKYDYRVTARATGITTDSEVVLQSTYRQDATPTAAAAAP
jgi:type IV pilus assembly protein PilX